MDTYKTFKRSCTSWRTFAKLRRSGIPHSPAQYDAGGNCLTCGEGGRCPGVHTFEEIQTAGREQKGNTL